LAPKAIITIGVLICLTIAIGAPAPALGEGVDAIVLKQFKLDEKPLDVDGSEDGKLMFVLVPGEVLVYSNFNVQPSSRIPVDKHYDRLSFAEKIDLLTLTSSTGKQVEMVQIDLINDISIEGSPFLGPADAPVTIAVFDDYQ